MDTDCANCDQKIQSLQFLKCQGFCDSVVHLHCTTLTVQNMRVVQQDANLFWFCNECVALMKTPHLRNAYVALGEAFTSLNKVHKETLQEVKTEVQNNTTSVKKLSSKIPTPLQTPTWPTNNKRRAIDIQSPEQHTQLSVPRSSIGKRVIPGLTLPVITSKPIPDDLWWIWLSGFQSSVTESDIKTLVKGCLSCGEDDPIEVKLLVKKGIEAASLPSVSFKVGVDKHTRIAAWTRRIGLKEFLSVNLLTSGSTRLLIVRTRGSRLPVQNK